MVMMMTIMISFKAFTTDIFPPDFKPGMYFTRKSETESTSLTRSRIILRAWKAITMMNINMKAVVKEKPSCGIKRMIAKAPGMVMFRDTTNTAKTVEFKRILSTRFLISSAKASHYISLRTFWSRSFKWILTFLYRCNKLRKAQCSNRKIEYPFPARRKKT